jgi:hypothetical protein
MKKILCMIALAAISFGSVYAVPVQQTDTAKTKIKVKKGKMKMKKKMMKDTMMKMKKDTMKM